MSNWLAAAGGLVAVAVTVGVAELLATLGSLLGLMTTATSGSPLFGLGATFIQFTPEWLKQLAISVFGVYDKVALRTGMGVVLAVVAALIGVLAVRRLALAQILLGVLGLVVLAAVYSRTQAGPVDVLPTAIGVLVGVLVLQQLFAAPTTVLVRQHLESFRSRFEGTGIVVQGLSRLSTADEKKAAKTAKKQQSRERRQQWTWSQPVESRPSSQRL